jgi:hypothetical protein
MTLSLYDDFSSDPKNLYTIDWTVKYKKYEWVTENTENLDSLPGYEVLEGPDP